MTLLPEIFYEDSEAAVLRPMRWQNTRRVPHSRGLLMSMRGIDVTCEHKLVWANKPSCCFSLKRFRKIGVEKDEDLRVLVTECLTFNGQNKWETAMSGTEKLCFVHWSCTENVVLVVLCNSSLSSNTTFLDMLPVCSFQISLSYSLSA